MTLGPSYGSRPRRNKLTLTAFGKTLLDCARKGIRTMIPARVLVYNPALQKADVTLQHNIVLNTDADESELLPTIVPQCPVAWQSAAAGLAYITMPLVPNDPGYLLISDRSLERWITQGVPVDPASGQTHSIIDGVFHPSLRSAIDVLATPTDPTATVIEGPLIKLGFGGVDFLIKGTTLAAALVPINTVLAAVPPASDPATVVTLANANKAAILAIIASISSALSVKTQTI